MITEQTKATAAEVAERLEALPKDTRSYITGVLDGLKRAEEVKAEAATETAE